MTERDDSTTATIERELRAVDRALATGAPDPSERELTEIALALAAEGEQPRPEFERSLGARVRTGFRGERRGWRPSLPSISMRRPPLPLLGGVTAALVALVVAVSITGTGDVDQEVPAVSDGGGESLAAPGATVTGEEGAAADDVQSGVPSPSMTISPAPPEPLPPIGGGRFAPGERERRIERTARLALSAPGDRLDDVADGIVRVTERYRGFVLSSSLSTGDDGSPGGQYELRIPATRLQPALNDLSALGEVRARTQTGQDVTSEAVTAVDQLQGARAERRSLLRRLERAASDTEAEALRTRLDLNAQEIRGLRAQVRDLRVRTDYATVSVELDQAGDDDGSGTGQSGLGEALDDALGSLSESVELLIRILGIAVPIGVVALIATLAGRRLQRTRREGALSN